MQLSNKLDGLIVCGGESSRMGTDKSLLDYHGRPQRYFIYTMLSTLCDETFISCNAEQAKTIEKSFNTIIDAPAYAGHGPMAGLLSAFDRYPGTNWLVVGCDYPFITRKALNDFIKNTEPEKIAAAFYNTKENMYDPMLAWYSYPALDDIKKMFAREEYSLQHFLKKRNAEKYFPSDDKLMQSVDTMEEFEKARKYLTAEKHIGNTAQSFTE
jgi:molybdopterin-guanine dinucleotide biosynthesis protein A